MATITVNAESPYQVLIAADASQHLVELTAGADRVALLHAKPLAAKARLMADILDDAGRRATLIELPVGEQAKTADVLVTCWDALAEAGFTRNDIVVGLGGGATTDIAGFVAASYLRGVGFVNVPTTVLGMVDAAVGGKTGINIAAGKNLVGAFWEPRAVLCDLDLLTGLPIAEVRSGLAEVVKCGFIADPEILDLVEADIDDSQDVSSDRFAELVRRAIQVKATVVSGDLREATSSGNKVGREALNYGHTLGHAIEKLEDFTWRHGEAISVGMVFAAELSHRLLGLDEAVVDQHRRILTELGLPIGGELLAWDELRATMALDKKSRGSKLRFVGVPELGKTAIIDGPDEDVLLDCFRSLSPA